MIKQAAERRCGPSVWRAFSPKRRKNKKEGGIYSHASHSKVVGLHVWMLKRTRYVFLFCFVFFLCSSHALFFFFLSLAPLRRNTSEACGLPFQWSGVRAPQSQVFVFISTRINRLSGLFRDQDQVQLLWVGWGVIPPHVQVFFNKVAPISVMLFVPFLFFPPFSSSTSSLSIFFSVYCLNKKTKQNKKLL